GVRAAPPDLFAGVVSPPDRAAAERHADRTRCGERVLVEPHTPDDRVRVGVYPADGAVGLIGDPDRAPAGGDAPWPAAHVDMRHDGAGCWVQPHEPAGDRDPNGSEAFGDVVWVRADADRLVGAPQRADDGHAGKARPAQPALGGPGAGLNQVRP